MGYACVCFVLHVFALFYDCQAVFVLASMPFRYIYICFIRAGQVPDQLVCLSDIYICVYIFVLGWFRTSKYAFQIYVYICVLYVHMFIYLYMFLYGRFRTSMYAFEIYIYICFMRAGQVPDQQVCLSDCERQPV